MRAQDYWLERKTKGKMFKHQDLLAMFQSIAWFVKENNLRFQYLSDSKATLWTSLPTIFNLLRFSCLCYLSLEFFILFLPLSPVRNNSYPSTTLFNCLLSLELTD